MGMYTEIYINADLVETTPDDVIKTLQAMCDKNSESEYLKGKPIRWSYMFNNGSYYTPRTECGKLTFDKISKQWSILAKGDIKNYGSEIEQFFEWIKKWCENEFIGYYRYEEDREPTLVYSDTI